MKRTRGGAPAKGYVWDIAKKHEATRKQRTYNSGRQLAIQPKQELKCFDVAFTGYNIDAAGTPPTAANPALNAMVNGAELYQRVGRKVYMKSLHFRGWVSLEATALQEPIRWILYYDAQPNGVAPTLAQLLQDSNAGAATTFFSSINLANRERFQILRDSIWAAPSSTYTAGVLTNTAFPDTSGRYIINEFVKLKGLEVVYNAVNGGTIADITSGAIGFFIFDNASDNSWNLDYQTRLRYYD